MKISKIELENVKCFSKKVLSLEKEDTGEPLSVCALVGANGSGKSTILKAIVAAFYALNENFAGALLEDDEITLGGQMAKIDIDLRFAEQERASLGLEEDYMQLEYRHCRDNDEEAREDALYIPQYVFDNAIRTEAEVRDGMNEYIRLVSRLRASSQAGLIMYYDPFRFVSKKNPAGPNLQMQEGPKTHALACNIDAEGSNLYRDVELKQWVVNMDYLRLKEPSERNQEIYKHIIKAFELLLHPLKFETINQNGSLVFIDEKNNQQITIDMLSDGFKSIFSIVLDIIKRLALAQDYENKEFYEKEVVILIDEIDCHIHPKWQKKLMPAFRQLFPNCQFIITTHSPYILDTLQEYEIRKVGEKEIL